MESSWHGRPAEREHGKSSAPPQRRAPKAMVRSSSDSSCMSGSPGSSPRRGALPPWDLGSSADSPRGSPQESPPLPEARGGHPPLRMKSFEILVRKPATSKPKPPPRKYFKGDSNPPPSTSPSPERATAPIPVSGPCLACGSRRYPSRRRQVPLALGPPPAGAASLGTRG